MIQPNELGNQMYDLCKLLFPICRSITGNGVRKTLAILKEQLPIMKIHEIPSGTPVFDWKIPLEWNIDDAFIEDPSGNKIVDFSKSNLHVVGYSVPVDKVLPLEELQTHLHSIPEQPNAIPYITSYYKEYWGFCLTDEVRKSLQPGQFHVVIKSSLKQGALSYGELIIPGQTSEEIFISTYVCHPSLANNELSGPAVTTFIAKWILANPNRYYTYRIIFIPETIGSITYLSKNLKAMKENIIAGFNLTCIGDDRSYSYLPSRNGGTIADKVLLHVLHNMHPDFKVYSYLDRGSDERQYCSPGVDLPVASIMRTKYAMYPEYHTSLDNLDLISPKGLFGGFEVVQKVIQCLEKNEFLNITVFCEPQLGKRGLYPSLSTKKTGEIVRDMMNLLAYCDGTLDLLEISDKIGVSMWNLFDIVDRMKKESLLIGKRVLRN